MALVFQTGGVIHGNEEAIRAWVDQGITGDLFVTAGGPLSASGQILPMAESLGELLRHEIAGVQVVALRFRYLNWEHNGRADRLLVKAIDARAHHVANVRVAIRLRPTWRCSGSFASRAQPSSRRTSAFCMGSSAATPSSCRVAEGPVPLRVIGMIADFSYGRGTVLVDRARYRHQFGVEQVDVFSVYLPPASQNPRLKRRGDACYGRPGPASSPSGY